MASSGTQLPRRRARYVAVAAAAAAASLLLSGCLSSNGKTSGTTGVNGNTSKNLTMIVAFSGSQFDDFKKSLLPYAKSQGINLTMVSDSNFNADIVNKVKSGNEPDIAMFPQPGILLDLAKQGKVADLNSVLDVNSLKQNMVNGLLNYGTLKGKLYGAPPSINVKSLVFYPKIAWAKAGLKPPTTLSQLLSFSAQLKSQNKTPWCMGIESGTATGWPATDWLEQLVLDYGGVNQYNGWISHKVKFNSPLVTKAANTFQKFFATPGWVAGGQNAIASNNFATAGNPMFNANNTESAPGCWMYKQGSFVVAPGDFPDPILKSQDKYLGVFRFPGTSASSKPVEGGGDLAALFSGKNQSAIKIMKYMLSPTFGAYAAKQGNLISPFKNFNMNNYPSALYKSMAQIAYSATQFAFDASDQMPGAVGTGTFWSEMTKWVSGQESTSSALSNIDNSWPTS